VQDFCKPRGQAADSVAAEVMGQAAATASEQAHRMASLRGVLADTVMVDMGPERSGYLGILGIGMMMVILEMRLTISSQRA
jgi:hypothetical protein